jgi:hypothetical protein
MVEPLLKVPVPLDALAGVVALLPRRVPREPDEAVCHKWVRIVEALLVRVGRARGALDVSIGDWLCALAVGDRALRLGYVSIGDYARERLGMAASTAQKMARFAKALRARPLLRAAVRAGEVSVRQAEAILPLAIGEDEAAWVARARRGTVRALKDAVKESQSQQPEDDEEWLPVRVQISPESLPLVDDAMRVAGKLLGATALKSQRFGAMCEEYIGGHAVSDDGDPDDGVHSEGGACHGSLASTAAGEPSEPLQEWLEQETKRWAFLDEVSPIAAPGVGPDEETDPRVIDQELRRLMGERERWDGDFGHLAMLFKGMKGWERLGFASFKHYCDERLGIGVRAVEQRAALERRLYELPALRQALLAKRLSYEKARLIARYAEEDSLQSWIDRAEKLTCIDLRRQLERQEETQMCARGEFEVWMPRRTVGLVAMAFRAARRAAGRSLSPGECVVRILAHFVETWGPVVDAERSTPHRKVLARDEGFCRVPGCSRAADHAHHRKYRSAGGSDDPENLLSLCAAHHLHGVHMGWIKVDRVAPDRLRWQLGVRPGFEPIVDVIVPEDGE